MPGSDAERTHIIEREELRERLTWLLRLRWLALPLFVAIGLANDLLNRRPAPFIALLAGCAFLALNVVCALLLRRTARAEVLLPYARAEAAIFLLAPVGLVLLGGDPSNPLRYAVLVAVVGAAALPGVADVAIVAAWGVASLVVADALALGLDPARVDGPVVARWAVEAGIVGAVAAIAAQLQRVAAFGPRRRAAEPSRTVMVATPPPLPVPAPLRSVPAPAPAAEVIEVVEPEPVPASPTAAWDPALDQVRDVVVVTDRAGRILRSNAAFSRLVGRRRHELAGLLLADVLMGHPDAWWREAPGAIELEDPVFDTVLELTTTVLGDEVLRVAQDVGEGRRLEARIVQADKLAAVGLLASSAAHEIGSPITFVSANLAELRRYVAAYEALVAELSETAVAAGFADRVRARLAADDVAMARREAAAAIDESQRGMERITRIACDVRSLARRDPTGEPAGPVDLGEVVRAVCRTAGAELRAGESRVDVEGAVWVTGHRGELVDVALNLVVNAIQARDGARPNRILVSLRREGVHVVLRVEDTGTGIPPAHLKRLFEPFFTTKPAGEGTGLGLSLARRIVAQHAGSIDVSSTPGVGTTFTVRLPALDEAPARDPKPRIVMNG